MEKIVKQMKKERNTKMKELLTDKQKSFLYEDFRRSGINDSTIKQYIDKGYLSEDENGWKMYYPALTGNFKTDYYTYRLKNPKKGQGKYLKPKGLPTRLFRPLHLPVSALLDKTQYLILTEGDKKAIKAVQEGFNCVSLSGVYCWKQNPDRNNDENADTKNVADPDDEVLYADIISDLKNFDVEGKAILLCYDSDMWHNPNVKQALYQLAALLISEKRAIVKIIQLPEGKAKGLDDFLIAYGADEFQKLIDNAKVVTLKDIQSELSDRKKLADFPVDIFPKDIAELILDMHEKYDAPLEYIASVFLAVVSIIICGHYYINVKPDSNWIEHAILWIALVGNPSQKKTPCLKIGKDILDEFDGAFETIYEAKKDEYNLQLADYESKEKAYKDNLKKGDTNRPGQKPIKPEQPSRPRFTTQNATIESMFDLINTNGTYNMGLAIYLDELTYLLNSFNQYKRNGNDKQYYLQSWNRTKQNIVRKSTKIDYTVDIGHNIIGSIQPKVLQKTLFKDGIESYDGMIERWLYVCSEYLEQGFKDISETSNTFESKQDNAFLQLTQKLYLYITDNINQTTEFYFDKMAQNKFITFCNSITKSKKSAKVNDLLASYLQKQTSYVARFSLILQCFYNFKEPEIKADIVNKAIILSRYFISCFISIINDKLETNPDEDNTITYLKAKGLKTISPTQLFKSNENKYKTTDRAKRVLENLARKGYGRVIKAKNGVKFVYYTD